MDLIEIVDKEEKIFFDSSVISHCFGANFLTDIYDSHHYNQLDDSLLDGMISGMDDRIRFLECGEQKGNLYTIEEAIEELGDLQKGIIEKQKYLNKTEKRFLKSSRMRDRYSSDTSSIEKFNDLGFKINQILRIIRPMEFKDSNNRAYNLLVKLLVTMSSYILKEKNPEDWDGTKLVSRLVKKENKHTDEKLFAAAFYKSLVDSTRNCIISGDTDFIILLNAGLGLIGAKDVEGNGHLIKSLIEYPVKLYFPLNKEGIINYESKFSTSTCKMDEKFLISYLGVESNNKVKKYVEYLLSQLNQVCEFRILIVNDINSA